MTWRPVDLDPVVLVMVGKPARGKTFTANRIARYLGWLGYRARGFNVGRYRREHLGAGHRPAFFDPRNAEGAAARKEMAKLAVDDLIAWVGGGGEVAILDATNSTRDRRAWVRQTLDHAGLPLVFVELQCDDPEIIGRNVRQTKVRSPDYEGMSTEDAVTDFFGRIAKYEDVYEPVREDEGPFVRIVDIGRKVELHQIHGFLPFRLVTFLTHLHDERRPILLSRHGESMWNVRGRIGGDSPLSPAGERYADNLGAWTDARFGSGELTVWSSTLERTKQTVEALRRRSRAWKLLDEIDAGVCDGLTYAQVQIEHPDEHQRRTADKFRYRYPLGESYQDVIARLDPVVLELERGRHPVLVVAHQAVLRCLLSYLRGSPPEACPFLEVPLHSVLEITPGPYHIEVHRHDLGPAVTA